MQDLEEQLFEFSVQEIRLFAREMSHETFNNFAFDCNSDYGQVGLCYNTQEHLESCEQEYKNKFATTKSMKWALGDWKYPGVHSIQFDSVLEAWLDQAEDEDEDVNDDDESESPTGAAFMHMVCRVLIRLESEGVFAALNRTDDFQTFAMNHDESELSAWRRLERTRNE